MKKGVAAVVAVIIVVVVALAFRGNGNSSSSNHSSQGNSASSSQTDVADQITIQNFAFSPANITVKKGAKVTWTNQDSTNHTVTETDGKAGPSSSPLGKGQSYSFTFSQAGTFHYECSIHTEMTGTITVTD